MTFQDKGAKRVGFSRPEPRRLFRLLPKREPPENTLFQIQKNLGGGNFKKYAKGFSGGAQHGFAVLGGGAELTSFARNRFALNRKTPPK
jgi:hypothetical protein